jgi:hypothetical protein
LGGSFYYRISSPRSGSPEAAPGHSGVIVVWDLQEGVRTVTVWETLKGDTQTMIERVKQLIHEGNLRRVIVQHQGRTIAEFPVTAGVIGVVLAPVVAALGAIVALLKDCTIKVEKQADTAEQQPPRAAAG